MLPKLEDFRGVSLIAYMSNLVKEHGGINLAQGIPGYDPPVELLDCLKLVSNKPVHQYPSGNGDADLIRQICIKYHPFSTLKPDEVLVTQGATEGISLVYTWLVSKYGVDWTAIAFDPVYESYSQLPRIYNNQLEILPLSDECGIPWEPLENLCRSGKVKLMFINSPGNPLARIWSQGEVEKAYSLARQYGFYIIFDAVYSDLFWDTDPPYIPLGHMSDRIFYVNSFSKLLSITGWRIGYLIGSSSMMGEIRAIHDYTDLCASAPLQRALALYLAKQDNGSGYAKEIGKQLQRSYNLLSGELMSLGFTFPQVHAGYFIWAALPESFNDGWEFSLSLFHEKRVAVVPGIHFSKYAGRTIRLNFARPMKELEMAAKALRTFKG